MSLDQGTWNTPIALHELDGSDGPVHQPKSQAQHAEELKGHLEAARAALRQLTVASVEALCLDPTLDLVYVGCVKELVGFGCGHCAKLLSGLGSVSKSMRVPTPSGGLTLLGTGPSGPATPVSVLNPSSAPATATSVLALSGSTKMKGAGPSAPQKSSVAPAAPVPDAFSFGIKPTAVGPATIVDIVPVTAPIPAVTTNTAGTAKGSTLSPMFAFQGSGKPTNAAAVAPASTSGTPTTSWSTTFNALAAASSSLNGPPQPVAPAQKIVNTGTCGPFSFKVRYYARAASAEGKSSTASSKLLFNNTATPDSTPPLTTDSEAKKLASSFSGSSTTASTIFNPPRLNPSAPGTTGTTNPSEAALFATRVWTRSSPAFQFGATVPGGSSKTTVGSDSGAAGTKHAQAAAASGPKVESQGGNVKTTLQRSGLEFFSASGKLQVLGYVFTMSLTPL